MKHILILGANGQLARNTTRLFLKQPDVRLTLYLRRANRLKNPDPARVAIVEGDVLDQAALQAAMRDQDVVYANLAGDMKAQAESIVQAMRATARTRLIFTSSMGIYGEVPGERYRAILDPYRDSSAVVEASGLDYTVLRPGWFIPGSGGKVQITRKGEPFRGHNVALDSLSALIVELATTPGLHSQASLGVSTN